MPKSDIQSSSHPVIESSEWWRGAVIYQVYPRSFLDTNGSGTGDLRGICEKLDYIAALGVDGIWISPFFKSPMKDFGYDVSDYRDVDPLFGALADFDALLEKAHKLDLKIIIDLVLSHTSNEHPWFNDPAKKDWYVRADGKKAFSRLGKENAAHNGQSDFSSNKAQGAPCRNRYISDEATQLEGKSQRPLPPNNWVSVFGGSAWEWDERYGQYYLHNFLPEQPDLNYHNPEVQKEALDICRFWLERGVDGFRLDVINFLFHDPELRDNPPRPDELGAATQFEGNDPYSAQAHIYDKSRPENLEFISRLRALLNEYGAMSVGEIGDDHPYARAHEYTEGNNRLHTAYNTHMMAGTTKTLTAGLIRKPIETFLSLPGKSWPSWAFSNHDVVRAASRWLPSKGSESDGFDHNPQFSKMLIALLGCLYGTAFLYQGEELGLPEAKLKREELQDPWGKNLWPAWQGRDGCRTPMPWNGAPVKNGWLPTPATHIPLNAEAQEQDPESPLNFTRRFLNWRKTQTPLIHGSIAFFNTGENVLAFRRSHEGKEVLCVFNLAQEDAAFEDKALAPFAFFIEGFAA